ncbi:MULTISPECIES: TrmH family RNA methyltransferase [Prauserella salsuginis group]|uniref:TrmH family RNA methyltransferase n=2 Tax=Prauserella salsuginis group TaxID=2893672 RepID=A0A839Y069_9PSEU|nr:MULTISPECIES: RNA methyltransferase [Prauserella salsuginis group]MBB3665355.1 TrmH family RNA methyltransferase [Prauserella sediminis]MCR3722325.1 RNA methyltransferase, TrmH family [Prauserella flava]MCR3736323.1 RNA methyltransferase, TrmH family [Prauserella salsuginis]
MFTHKTPRVVAARRLTTKSGRDDAGRFLAEGAQAVREALRFGRVHELFVTETAAERHADLVAEAPRVSLIDRRAAELLSETVSPQGLIAVCDTVTVPLDEALSGQPRLVAVLCDIADPGNAGTVLRVADAAGADAVVFAGDAVDAHNGKCVRASTGSLFHLPVARERDTAAVLEACGRAGLRTIATDGHAEQELPEVSLDGPIAWLFGNEAHGLPAEVTAAADDAVRVPIAGRAESLNLATAAAVCLYARVVRDG